METTTLQIQVSTEAALAYRNASKEQQRKIDALLSLKLCDVGRSKKSLEDIMSDISQKAQSRGMTPEILESLLNE